MNNADFFTSGSGRSSDFPTVLLRTQEYMAHNYYSILSDGEGGERDRQQLLRYIRQYLLEEKYSVEGLTQDARVDRLYDEMAGFSFLTPYLNFNIPGVEEININSWDDTKVHFSDGRVERAPMQFFSPSHAIDVIRRLLGKSSIILDNASPCVRGHLLNKIRITVNGPGVVDDEVGLASSIRFVNPENLDKEDFIRGGTATEEMLDFMYEMYRYGLSECIAGSTGTGKTTLMSMLFRRLPPDKRIYTIENGTREFNFVNRAPDGSILNNIVHTVTRYSKDPAQNITQQILLEQGLTMDPDYIGMAEIKGAEAKDAQEAARTGHPVLSTVHSNSASGILSRIVSLCKEASNLDDKTLYSFVTEAFPLGVYIKRHDDYVRRVVSICEFEYQIDGGCRTRTLYRFRVEQNSIVGGKPVIHGQFEKVNIISEQLQQRLRDNGMPEELLKRFVDNEKSQ